MIDGGGNIGCEHAKEIEAYAKSGPGVVALKGHHEEQDAKGNSHDDACCVAPRVPELFLMCIAYGHDGKV